MVRFFICSYGYQLSIKKWLTLMKFRIPSYTLRTMYGYHTCNAYMIISVIFNILFIYIMIWFIWYLQFMLISKHKLITLLFIPRYCLIYMDIWVIWIDYHMDTYYGSHVDTSYYYIVYLLARLWYWCLLHPVQGRVRPLQALFVHLSDTLGVVWKHHDDAAP